MFKVAVAVGPVRAFHKTVDLHSAVPGFYRDCFEKKRPGSGRRFFSGRKYLLVARAECPDWHRVTEKAAVTQITSCRIRILQQTVSVSKKNNIFFCIGSTWPREASSPTSLTFFLQNFCRFCRKILLLGCIRYFLDALWIPQHQQPKIILTPTTSRVLLPTTPRPSAAAARRLSADGDFQRDDVAKLNHHEHDSEFTGLQRPQSRSPAVKSQWSGEATGIMTFTSRVSRMKKGNSHFWCFFPARMIGIIPLSLKSLS